MRRALLVALSAVAVTSQAGANGIDRAPLRGSSVYEAPSYPVDVVPGAYRQPVVVEPDPLAQPIAVGPPVPAASLPFRFEVGGRYWFSFGNLTKRLYDIAESSPEMVSRLTYKGLSAHSAELFARADHPTGLLIKGYVGLTGMQKGWLNDEDFTPFIDPYSSTMSSQRGGQLNYGAADLGYTGGSRRARASPPSSATATSARRRAPMAAGRSAATPSSVSPPSITARW
jgi:hypothetical protein